MSSLEHLLAEGIRQQSLTVDQSQQQQLLQFVMLLDKWNRTYNLTSITDPEDMIRLHLLDSLVMLPFLAPGQGIKRVLDVGTGGGIPGIPLAICLPDIEFVLLDARSKKIRFIQTVIAQLGLNNVRAVHSRVEDYHLNSRQGNDSPFERVISRAFASLSDMLRLCQHLCHRNGKFLAMKGQIPKEEIAQLPEGFRIEEIVELKIYGLNARRHLIQIVFDMSPLLQGEVQDEGKPNG